MSLIMQPRCVEEDLAKEKREGTEYQYKVDMTEALSKMTQPNHGDGPAAAKHGNILTRCLLKLLHDMNVDLVLDAIAARGLIDDMTLRNIREQRITSDKIRKLVRLIDKHKEYVYKPFKDCLHQTCQSDLAKVLEKEEKKTTARRNPSQGKLKEDSHILIRHNYRELKWKVLLDGVLDYLIQDEVLDWNDYDEIKQYPETLGTDRLLQKLLRKSQSAFESFWVALEKLGQTELANKLKMPLDSLTVNKPEEVENIHKLWPKIKEYLMEELTIESVLDFFMEMDILNLDEYEFLFHCNSERRKKTEEFLTRISDRLPKAFNVLCNALEVKKEGTTLNGLKKIIEDGPTAKDLQKTYSDIKLLAVEKKDIPFDGSLPNIPCIKLVLKTNPDEKPASEVEHAMNDIINDEKAHLLNISTGCVIEKSETGSVIIYLRPVSRFSYAKLLDFCKSGGLEEFVLNVLKEEKITHSLHHGNICIDVQVLWNQEESLFEGIDESKSMTSENISYVSDENSEMIETIRENIIVHFEVITEEIDPIFFEKLFVDRGIFSNQFFMNLKETCKNRKSRATEFLKEVLVQGGKTVIALTDALKENRCNFLLEKLNPAEKELNSRHVPCTDGVGPLEADVQVPCQSGDSLGRCGETESSSSEDEDTSYESFVDHGAIIMQKEDSRKINVHSKAGPMWSCSMTVSVDKHTIENIETLHKVAGVHEGVKLAVEKIGDFGAQMRAQMRKKTAVGKKTAVEIGKTAVVGRFAQMPLVARHRLVALVAKGEDRHRRPYLYPDEEQAAKIEQKFHQLTELIGDCWNLAKTLGLRDAEINRIKMDNKTSQEQCFHILQTWKKKYAKADWVNQLLQACQISGVDPMHQVEEIFKGSSSIWPAGTSQT